MFRFDLDRVAVGVTAVIVVVCTSARVVAFNPQPEPPGDIWNVQGFVELAALTSAPTGEANPFHVDPSVIGDGLVDFHGGVIATFSAPTNPLTGKPQDGIVYPTINYFRLQIGDTGWDETMIPAESIEFQLQGGLVTGMRGTLTVTRPGHPNLAFVLPSSPGTWVATDDRDGVNLGTISGNYDLRDGVVPEPGTWPLLLAGPLIFNRYRRT